MSNDLLSSLKKDKCVVCYSGLSTVTGPLLACPICGHGGHKEHLEEWFKSKTVCPSCGSDVTSSNYLVFT